MSSPSIQVLDSEAIENLRALGDEGDDTFLREIIGIYLEDVPQRLNDLKTAQGANDRPLFTRSAHTIKGSSANVGATEVRVLAEKLEHSSKSEALAALDEQVGDLEAAFARARQALQSLIG
ncbi:MAG: Hpt domain-containing protein [Burkholderiales bacterium]|nr:Hpt domain-containing protein [Opitutaceae bacterium]